jgi:hypothetical protein
MSFASYFVFLIISFKSLVKPTSILSSVFSLSSISTKNLLIFFFFSYGNFEKKYEKDLMCSEALGIIPEIILATCLIPDPLSPMLIILYKITGLTDLQFYAAKIVPTLFAMSTSWPAESSNPGQSQRTTVASSSRPSSFKLITTGVIYLVSDTVNGLHITYSTDLFLI